MNTAETEIPIMKHEFTAVIEKDEDWFIAWCPEIPGFAACPTTRNTTW